MRRPEEPCHRPHTAQQRRSQRLRLPRTAQLPPPLAQGSGRPCPIAGAMLEPTADDVATGGSSGCGTGCSSSVRSTVRGLPACDGGCATSSSRVLLVLAWDHVWHRCATPGQRSFVGTAVVRRFPNCGPSYWQPIRLLHRLQHTPRSVRSFSMAGQGCGTFLDLTQ